MPGLFLTGMKLVEVEAAVAKPHESGARAARLREGRDYFLRIRMIGI
jgi:hypothetical protein